jgi:hypothetical protein
MTNCLHPLLPRRSVPALRAPLVDGGTFDLPAERPERFTLVAGTTARRVRGARRRRHRALIRQRRARPTGEGGVGDPYAAARIRRRS